METTGRKRTKITKEAIFTNYEVVGDPPYLRNKRNNRFMTLGPGMIYDEELGVIPKASVLFTLYFGFVPEQKVTPSYLIRVLYNNGEPNAKVAKVVRCNPVERKRVFEYLSENFTLEGDELVRKSDGLRRKYPGGTPSKSRVYLGPGLHPLEWSAIFKFFKSKDNAPLQQSTD